MEGYDYLFLCSKCMKIICADGEFKPCGCGDEFELDYADLLPFYPSLPENPALGEVVSLPPVLLIRPSDWSRIVTSPYYPISM